MEGIIILYNSGFVTNPEILTVILFVVGIALFLCGASLLARMLYKSICRKETIKGKIVAYDQVLRYEPVSWFSRGRWQENEYHKIALQFEYEGNAYGVTPEVLYDLSSTHFAGRLNIGDEVDIVIYNKNPYSAIVANGGNSMRSICKGLAFLAAGAVLIAFCFFV